jgi:hypothetical protein
VTYRAIIQRINRALKKDQEALKSDRRGAYMRIDLSHNAVIELNVNISEMAKELKVLKPWEKLEEE